MNIIDPGLLHVQHIVDDPTHISAAAFVRDESSVAIWHLS